MADLTESVNLQPMSTQLPTAKPLHLLTLKEQRYLKARLAGDERTVALRKAGLPDWMRGRDLSEVEALVIEATQALAELRFSEGLIDAHEIHQFLTDAVRAKRSDIQNDDLSYKPISEWPEIWQQMAEDGSVMIEYLNERSHDGATKDKRGGWDQTGVIKNVIFKFGAKTKWVELAMKHKGVDAMAAQKSNVDLNLKVTAELAREVLSARKRLASVVDVTPE